MVASIILAIVIGYLLGSIPCAYIAGRLIKGVDIRRVGGGNVGALNVMREIGTTAGFAVFFGDIAKGSLAVLVAQWLGLPLIAVFFAGLAAVVGHNWPVWLKFRGGQGLGTTMGVLLVLAPIEFAISFAIIAIVIFFTSNARLASAVGLVFLPLIIWLFGGELSLIVYSIALPLFCVLKALTRLRADLASAGSKGNFIIDRQYKPWQRRK
ncbi:MAG: glycerol-3-phosphate acyltransferase [Dehalococcoidales bacterium]|nr:glycerol-3-phosphate acyltransferase [Dehalococcoidales bacterium]